jgi:hypothetical protein
MRNAESLDSIPHSPFRIPHFIRTTHELASFVQLFDRRDGLVALHVLFYRLREGEPFEWIARAAHRDLRWSIFDVDSLAARRTSKIEYRTSKVPLLSLLRLLRAQPQAWSREL